MKRGKSRREKITSIRAMTLVLSQYAPADSRRDCIGRRPRRANRANELISRILPNRNGLAELRPNNRYVPAHSPHFVTAGTITFSCSIRWEESLESIDRPIAGGLPASARTDQLFSKPSLPLRLYSPHEPAISFPASEQGNVGWRGKCISHYLHNPFPTPLCFNTVDWKSYKYWVELV